MAWVSTMAVQHQIAAFERALGMAVGRQIAGRLDDSRDQRRFRQGNVLQILVEIGLRRLRQIR